MPPTPPAPPPPLDALLLVVVLPLAASLVLPLSSGPVNCEQLATMPMSSHSRERGDTK
jgi:hypothetical protein